MNHVDNTDLDDEWINLCVPPHYRGIGAAAGTNRDSRIGGGVDASKTGGYKYCGVGGSVLKPSRSTSTGEIIYNVDFNSYREIRYAGTYNMGIIVGSQVNTETTPE